MSNHHKPILPEVKPDLAHAIGLFVVFLVAMLLSSTVFAATPPGLVDLDALRASSAVDADIATDIMTKLFGPIFTDPWATVASGSTTLFGVIFLAFNVVVFSAGVSWATYGVLSGVVQSAHEGEVLGKRMSAIWMPIRMVTGIGTLVPAFGGFSLSQVIMIVAAGWGITFGNYAYKAALDAANQFTPLVDLSAGTSGNAQSTLALANTIFKQELCIMDFERLRDSMGSPALSAADTITVGNFAEVSGANGLFAGGRAMGASYGKPSDPTACYAVGIRKKNWISTQWNTRDSVSLGGFRNDAVNYAAIGEGAYARYEANYPAFEANVRALARQWAANVLAANSNSATSTVSVISTPITQISALAQGFTGQVKLAEQADLATAGPSHSGAITESALANMQMYGFLGAGAYYSVFSEATTAISQAANAVDFVILTPSQSTSAAVSSEEVYRLQNAYAKSEKIKGAGATDVHGWCESGLFGTPIGECSVGQAFVTAMIGGATAGGAAGPSIGVTGRIIDPIMAAKNVGDYMMMTGEAILIMAKAASVASAAIDTAASVASVVPGGGMVLKAASKIPSKLLEELGAVLPMIAGVLMIVGALLGIYIPMVPFISWVSAIVQYFSIVVEALAAAPLWSFAHLQPDGEGMGQRSERGYLYLLLLLFKPILMVVAFFAACGLVVLIGSAVLWLFVPAMASAQGNSVTGILSIVGYILIFFVLMNIIIQGLFNMVMDLSDDVLGWVGNVGKSQAGRDTEGKAHSLFVSAGRMGGQGIRNMSGLDGARAGLAKETLHNSS